MMNNEIQVFSDWSAVSQLKNFIDPNFKVSSTAIIVNEASSDSICECKSCDTVSRINGYILTVYQRFNPDNIIYRVRVESDKMWSLSTEQAVIMLNSLGFTCEYKAPDYSQFITDQIRETLKILVNLGYTHIVRKFECGKGKVEIYDVDDNLKSLNLSEVYDKYNYIDWSFLPISRPTPIENLLKNF